VKRFSLLMSVLMSVLFLVPAMFFGCDGSEKNEAVLVVEGEEIGRKEFEYQLVSMMSAYEYYSGSPINWTLPIDGMTPEEYFKEQAADSAVLYRTVKIKGDEMGLGLTEDERAQIEKTILDMIEQAGGEKAFDRYLESQGLDRSLYTLILTGPEEYYKIFQNLYGEDGSLHPTEDLVGDYYHSEYIRTRHIVLYLTDENGNPLDSESKKKQRSKMDDICNRLKAGEDFGSLMDEYNEDMGINGSSISFSYGEMPEDYYQASVSLEPGEFSEILQLDGFLCIINRLPLEDSFLEENFESIRDEYATFAFNELLEEWKDDLEIKKTPLYNNIDVRAVYSASIKS